ncbi:hypothetical protein ASZ78_007500 [Callipepla squamata]|uniref:FERM domain-containing protein n=1 Tax=Callipepla squamata TaxID=9009 RepID=A0A226NGC6_CALSU|nr:hypothetical protein ASZ78_007500 [Callipepla squamata]
MTTESGSDSESKDKEQDQQEAPAQPGAAAEVPPQEQQQLSEEHQSALEQFSAVAAHSTPVRKEQPTDKEQEFAAASAKQLEYQQLEDDKLSQKSSSSKLSKSPLKIVKKPKNMQCKVTLLDGSEYACEVEKRSRGQVLFDKVCEHLNLLEKDYFGLTYRDTENQKTEERKHFLFRIGWTLPRKSKSRSESMRKAALERRVLETLLSQVVLIVSARKAAQFQTADVKHIKYVSKLALSVNLCSFPGGAWQFAFNVKFYPPDPAQLSEDITRCLKH